MTIANNTGSVNQALIAACERLSIQVPPIEDRKAVFEYLLTKGFSQREAMEFDCMGRDYEVALDGMRYHAQQKSKTKVVSGGLNG